MGVHDRSECGKRLPDISATAVVPSNETSERLGASVRPTLLFETSNGFEDFC